MNDDYLWDKSGKPDPEIQELEDALSAFRYQPRPFQVPNTAQPVKRHWVTKGLAIAAAIAMVLLGLGIWLGLNRQPTKPVENAKAPVNNPSPSANKDQVVQQKPKVEEPKPIKRSQDAVASNLGSRRTNQRSTGVSSSQRREAENAKQQLFIALRVASSKLNQAQKRAQGAPTIIRNQHKIG